MMQNRTVWFQNNQFSKVMKMNGIILVWIPQKYDLLMKTSILIFVLLGSCYSQDQIFINQKYYGTDYIYQDTAYGEYELLKKMRTLESI